MKPLLIAIGGGTGSGKTRIARTIIELLDDRENSNLIHLDNYYLDLSHLTPVEREKTNFDHPDSFDWALFRQHLNELITGKQIELPDYCFIENNRLSTSKTINPTKIMLFEGIFALHDEECNNFFDLRIFIDADSDVRFARRLKRDIKKRGRTHKSIVESWMTNAKPMHERFVEPYKRHAHIIIPDHGREVSLNLLKEGLKGISNQTQN